MLSNGRRRYHIDGVPGAPALAQRAADAALEVDVHERLQHRLVVARHLVDTIDRADFNARLAAGAVVRADDRQFLGKLLPRLARTLGHTDPLVMDLMLP